MPLCRSPFSIPLLKIGIQFPQHYNFLLHFIDNGYTKTNTKDLKVPGAMDMMSECTSVTKMATSRSTQPQVLKQERRDAYTCVFSVVVFVVLTMPDTIISTMSTFADDLYHYMDRETSLVAISLLNMRSVITPAIYFYQQRYRRF